MRVDAHCHLNLEPLFPDWRSWYQPCLDGGRVLTVVPGTTIETSQRAIEIALEEATVYAAVGIHPSEVEDSSLLEPMLTNPRVVAVGECGLDIREDTTREEIERQTTLFQSQLQLADNYGFPVIVHCRQAFDQILSLASAFPTLTYIFHCFSGTKDHLDRCLALNSYISLAGNVTFANARVLRELVPLIPDARLLLETDAPYLNPSRGVFPNPPEAIRQTYQTVAELNGISADVLATRVLANAGRAFDIELPTDDTQLID